jgi:hypothetical protein
MFYCWLIQIKGSIVGLGGNGRELWDGQVVLGNIGGLVLDGCHRLVRGARQQLILK